MRPASCGLRQERQALQLLALVASTRSSSLTDREFLEQTPPLATMLHPRFGFGEIDDGRVAFWIAIGQWRPFLFILDAEEIDLLSDGLRDARQGIARQSRKLLGNRRLRPGRRGRPVTPPARQTAIQAANAREIA
jgi:hypothetical protein